ncbi:hypothetical protein [Nonomuraea pusilla]|uniref:Uncharacterized protein n=1 Tax=Nonomuraea pusilla TaxID=46177 RepID=A0A1H8JDA7_9ACTN|nr:hypothetical protein [Nonomuraea pusilla]SEN78760.1 hypothetical protein SAMN05660976_08316 [Nonomuraea pusilla]
MDDRYQPGSLCPNDRPGTASAPGSSAGPAEDARSFDELTAEKITAVRHAYYAAAAEGVTALQNGRWLSGEQLFAAAHSQASRAWWDLVDQEITGKRLTSDHAVRRVRSWARHYLTGEPPAARPGTLFDHALAHASRIAARDFLTVSGQLLTQHLAEARDGADVRAPGMRVDNRHPASSLPNPVVLPAIPSTRADAP